MRNNNPSWDEVLQRWNTSIDYIKDNQDEFWGVCGRDGLYLSAMMKPAQGYYQDDMWCITAEMSDTSMCFHDKFEYMNLHYGSAQDVWDMNYTPMMDNNDLDVYNQGNCYNDDDENKMCMWLLPDYNMMGNMLMMDGEMVKGYYNANGENMDDWTRMGESMMLTLSGAFQGLCAGAAIAAVTLAF